MCYELCMRTHYCDHNFYELKKTLYCDHLCVTNCERDSSHYYDNLCVTNSERSTYLYFQLPLCYDFKSYDLIRSVNNKSAYLLKALIVRL